MGQASDIDTKPLAKLKSMRMRQLNAGGTSLTLAHLTSVFCTRALRHREREGERERDEAGVETATEITDTDTDTIVSAVARMAASLLSSIL